MTPEYALVKAKNGFFCALFAADENSVAASAATKIARYEPHTIHTSASKEICAKSPPKFWHISINIVYIIAKDF